MKDSLNQDQLAAIEHIKGPILVLAGAGSGKTRVVTTRIVHLLEQGVHPGRILGVTFTNKAAGEMRERVARLTHCHVLICTFHSLGARILRESIDVLGYKRDYTIYDVEDTEKLLKHCLVDLNHPEKKKEVKIYREKISRAKNALESPTDVCGFDDPLFPKVYQLYQAKLKECNALDFDDLIYLPVILFREYPEILEHYQNRWDFLLIDEYQDTNAVQYAIVNMLVQKHHNLCVVGDPDQSIYAWRGADIHNILHFEKDYPGAKVIRLEQNYRSVQTILAAATAVISHNTERYEKSLWSQRGEGEKIKVYGAKDERDEAAFVAGRIKHHEYKNTSLDDIVVFYRTHFQSRALEDEFLAQRIPYVIIGGISFYQRREIKDILSFLKIVQSGADFVAFARTINLPKRGIGDTSIEKFRIAAAQAGMGIYDYCKDLLESIKSPMHLTSKQKTGLQDYINLIENLRGMLRQKASLKDIVIATIEDSGYLQVLKEEPDTLMDRKENLDSLISKAMEWEAMHQRPDLAAFLEELTLKSTLDEADATESSVKLMTLHNSKGLEFPIAFIIGLEEELFPHANSRDSQAEIEEERRLCYVGMTRAKDLLYLSHCSERFMWGMYSPHRKSRFLFEIPHEYIERIRTSRLF